MHTRPARSFVLFVSVLVIVSLACGIDFGGKTETAAPPPPATQEQEAQATEAPAATEEVVSTGQQFGTFDFDAQDDNWQTVLNVTGRDTNLSNMTTEFSDGFLSFDIDTKNLYTYVNYTAYDYSDVRVDARVENRGTNNNNISLICRYTEDEGWYEFNVANNGLWWIFHGLIEADGTPVYTRLYNGGSNDIKQGKDVNEYGAVCRGRSLTLYINGKEVKTVEDNEFVLRSGQVGVSVSSFDDLPVKVDFDWVKISEP